MWGINPITVGKIIGGVSLTSALLGRHGSVKLLSQKFKLYVAAQNAEAAKSMARAIASQDRTLYEKLKRELADELDPQHYEAIFGD